MNNYILLIPIFLPALMGIILPLIKGLYDNSKLRHLYVLVCTLITFAFVCVTTFNGEADIILWYLIKDIPVFIHFDKLGMLFALLTSFMWIVNSIFAFEYMKHEGREIRYFSFFLISLTALLGVCYSGNLVTAYVFYEFMSIFTMPLVLHSNSIESINAAKKYLFYSMGGAFAGLSAFFVLFQYGKDMRFIPGGSLDIVAASGHMNMILAVSILFIIGFGSKAGMWPLHGWLPTAHPVAPAPASALLSGNITKMGVLMIIRYIYYVVGVDILRDTWVQYTFIVLALLTVLMGSMMAYKEEILKKRLAYSTVSQVSYILFGVACMHPIAMVGAIMHVVFHSIVKNTLFLNAGAIIYKTGKTRVSELLGIGKQMPVAMWCYTLVSLTLVGIPPTSAFISKWYLAIGSLSTEIPVSSWLGPVVLLVSALLTAGYLVSITIKGFFPGSDFDYENLEICEPSLSMLIPIIVLTVLAVCFGICPGFLYSFIENINRIIF